MKKITIPLLAGFIALSSVAFSQSIQDNKFTPAGNTALSLGFVKISEKNSITASLFSGKVNGADAFGVQLSNSSNGELSFSWVIRDKNGKAVLESKGTTLGAGQAISALQTDGLSFPLSPGQLPGDFSIEINIK